MARKKAACRKLSARGGTTSAAERAVQKLERAPTTETVPIPLANSFTHRERCETAHDTAAVTGVADGRGEHPTTARDAAAVLGVVDGGGEHPPAADDAAAVAGVPNGEGERRAWMDHTPAVVGLA